MYCRSKSSWSIMIIKFKVKRCYLYSSEINVALNDFDNSLCSAVNEKHLSSVMIREILCFVGIELHTRVVKMVIVASWYKYLIRSHVSYIILQGKRKTMRFIRKHLKTKRAIKNILVIVNTTGCCYHSKINIAVFHSCTFNQ